MQATLSTRWGNPALRAQGAVGETLAPGHLGSGVGAAAMGNSTRTNPGLGPLGTLPPSATRIPVGGSNSSPGGSLLLPPNSSNFELLGHHPVSDLLAFFKTVPSV